MEITTFKRYEKKFKLTKEQYNKLIPRLEKYMIPDEHCKKDGGYKGIRPQYDDYFINQVLDEMEYFFKNNDILEVSLTVSQIEDKVYN